MVDDRPREVVLGVGVDVHLHDAVVERLADLLQQRAAAAVEDEVERLRLAHLLSHRVLDLLEDRWTQLDVARVVDAVDVAERGGKQIAAVLAGAERLGGEQRVFRGRVELLVDGADHAVLFTADDADLHLQHDLRLLAFGEELAGDAEVLLQADRRAVPHVGLEQGSLSAGDPLLADLDEGPHVFVELVLGAVVGVQGDLDGVPGGHHVGVLGQRRGAHHHVGDLGARQVGGAARGDLNDAVAAGVGEALQRGVEGLRRADVDGRVGKGAGLRPIEHLRIGLRARNRHEGPS